jgi:predicted PurR-regulated permease PerM
MLSWLLYNIILSMLIIFIAHYLYNYFITQFTKPKVIDLVHKPNERYNEILDKIKNDNTLPISSESESKNDDNESISTNMVDELQNFLNTQVE